MHRFKLFTCCVAWCQLLYQIESPMTFPRLKQFVTKLMSSIINILSLVCLTITVTKWCLHNDAIDLKRRPILC